MRVVRFNGKSYRKGPGGRLLNQRVSRAARSSAARLRSATIVDSVFSKVLGTTRPTMQMAAITLQREFIDNIDFLNWMKTGDPLISQAVLGGMATIIEETLKSQIRDDKTGQPVSPATLEILRTRSELKRSDRFFYNSKRGFNPGRIPLHRPYRVKNNLLRSITVVVADEKSGGSLSGQLFVGIPGDITHPENPGGGQPMNMARLARNMEQGYQMVLSERRKAFFKRITKERLKKEGKTSKEIKKFFSENKSSKSVITVPPRPILKAVEDLITGRSSLKRTMDRNVEKEVLKVFKNSGTKVGKKVRSGGPDPTEMHNRFDPELVRKAAAYDGKTGITVRLGGFLKRVVRGISSRISRFFQ